MKKFKKINKKELHQIKGFGAGVAFSCLLGAISCFCGDIYLNLKQRNENKEKLKKQEGVILISLVKSIEKLEIIEDQ